MKDNVRCKIDTEVFESVNGMMMHFFRSISDIRGQIECYLENASADFALQLDRIENLLRLAEADEGRLKDDKKQKKKDKENAEQVLKGAEDNYQAAVDNVISLQTQYNDVQQKCTDAYDKQQREWEAWQAAKEEQQDAYHSMKNHEISYYEFEDYIYATSVAKGESLRAKNEFDQIKGEKNAKKQELDIAKSQKKSVGYALKDAEKNVKQAKMLYEEAERRYENAVRIRKMREANYKDAKRRVVTFESYKDDYYHPYLFEKNISCDVILTMMCDHARKDFGQTMDDIRIAVNNILRCSLKEGVKYEEINYVQPYSHEKTWEEDHRIREGLRVNKKKLDKELKQEYEHPDYTEVCKTCGRLLRLCNCPKEGEPQTLTD